MATRTPLVLIPGLLCDPMLWQPQIAALADIAICWVADHRAGEAGADEATTMRGIAARILADCPFERFALAGLSMGGYLSLEVIRQAPGRVERLALLDTSAWPDTPEQTANRQRLLALVASGRFSQVPAALWPMLVHSSREGDASLRAIVETMAIDIGPAGFVRQTSAIMSRPDSRPMLAGIVVPTLVLCGREDRLTPLARHEEMASALPGARLEVIENCGHLSTLEDPAAVNRALRLWLRAPDARRV